MTPHPHDATEPCPGGCDDVIAIERRLNDGSARMNSIESALAGLGAKLDLHITTSQETNTSVLEVLSILQAGKGFFRIMGYFATAIKWTAGLAAPLIALWLTLKEWPKH